MPSTVRLIICLAESHEQPGKVVWQCAPRPYISLTTKGELRHNHRYLKLQYINRGSCPKWKTATSPNCGLYTSTNTRSSAAVGKCVLVFQPYHPQQRYCCSHLFHCYQKLQHRNQLSYTLLDLVELWPSLLNSTVLTLHYSCVSWEDHLS